MVKTYPKLRIGSPFDSNTLVGPLHSKQAVDNYLKGLEEIKK